MTSVFSEKRNLRSEIAASGTAPDIAGAAALLEVGEALGLVGTIGSSPSFTALGLAAAVDLPEEGVAQYLEALAAAGIVTPVPDDPSAFRAADDFAEIRHQAGYVSWAMNANRPFIEHAREFLTDPERAKSAYHRNGRHVAVSSQWMGSMAFYPAALETISDAAPKRLADLGSGTCRLLIEILLASPETTGVGLDIDPAACAAARQAAEDAGVADRLTVFELPIQTIAEDPSPLEGVDLVHAGFVFHDMMPEEEQIADRVLTNCRDTIQKGGVMAITEAVPYARSARERRFSSIVTYYHQQFMYRRLLTEDEWRSKLLGAGFFKVDCIELGFPTGRLFVATK